MPTFNYKGYEFQTEHQPTAEEFQQMSAYVDTLPPKEAKEEKKEGFLDKAAGVLDTAAGMIAGTPAQIAGGLYGASTLLSGQGLDKANENMNKVVESNFGAGAYKPATETGARYTENVGKAMDYLPGKAGDAGEYLGSKVGLGNEGRLTGELLTQAAMELIDPTVGLGLVAKGVHGRKMKPMTSKSTKALEDVVGDSKEAAKIKEDFLKSEKGTQGDLFSGTDQTPRVEVRGTADSVEPTPKNRRQMAFEFGEKMPEQINVDSTGEAVRSDANPNDLYARDAQAKKLMDELDAEVARLAPLENQTSLEGPDGQMSLFDQADVMGKRNQFNAGDLGDWRIDENGMPVRADKAMEAANLEAPLQRNLFGDELGPALGNDVSLTQSIDNTPANGNWAQRRGMTNRLGGNAKELEAGPDLLAAKMAADGLKLPTIDESMFEPKAPLPTERLGSLPPEAPMGLPEPPATPPVAPTGGVDHTSPSPGGVEIHPTDTGFVAVRDGKVIGKLDSNMTPEQNKQLRAAGEDLPASVDIVRVDPDVKGGGVGRALYDAWNAAHEGNVAPSGKTTAEAWRVWKREYPEKVNKFINDEAQRSLTDINNLRNITDDTVRRAVAERMDFFKQNESQTGASAKLEPLPPAERPVQADTIAHPISPEKVAQKLEKERAVKNMPAIDPKLLDEFTGIRTKEEVKVRLEESGYKDISRGIANHSLTSGMNTMAAMTNSPVLKYARTVLRDARVAAEAYSRKYITAKDGLSPTWSKLTGEQRVDVMRALREGDAKQVKINNDMMTELGFTAEQKNFVNKFYEADDWQYNRYNGNLVAAGMKPLPYREGHFPGIFKGAYKALVVEGDKTVGVIAVDSKYQMAAAKKKFSELHPNAEIVEQARKGLADYKSQSDIFSGMNDVMQLLAEHDPKFAEVQTMVSEAIKHGNNSLFAFNRHELSKKGVIGNEGNKPWLDAKENSEASFKAVIQYLEEGALHHELQQPLKDLRELGLDPDMKQIPNTMDYLDSYVKNVTGQNVGSLGRAFDAMIDLGPKLMGFGPRVPLQFAGAMKNRMSQLFMGFGNWTFTAAQLMQPMQTGTPFLKLIQERLNGSLTDLPKTMANGGTQFMLAGLEQATGKQMSIVQPHMREAFKYAQERGLLNFSEMEKAYEGHKSKFGRGLDKVAEANMKLGETATRTPMFMTFVDMLHKKGVKMDDALPIAENLTQLSMIDYHAWERPQVYNKLGTVGTFAGGLTTFKHGFMGQQYILGKNAIGKNPVGKAQVAPLAMSVASAIALAGIAGLPFYDEADNIVGYLTNTFGDKRQNIREAVLSNAPEWLKSGAIANATNVGIGSKFSSANMVPDTIPKALSPQLEALMQIVNNAVDLAMNRDMQGARNLLQSAVPSSVRGLVESGVARDEEDYLIGKDGQRKLYRSPEDWKLREITGMRPQTEVIANEELYKQRLTLQADQERLKKISQDFTRKEINQKLTPAEIMKLEQEAIKRGGNPGALVNRIGQASVEKQKTEKQRLEGVNLNTVTGMRKFQNYNTGVNKPGER